MYYIKKIFEVPISHRLSKHLGKCFLLHGHNLYIEVEVKSSRLNDNDMVMDFSKLKEIVNSIISSWDHGLFINKTDKDMIENIQCDLHVFDCDPTSEVLCKFLYDELYKFFNDYDEYVNIEAVSIWETKTSKSTYKV